MILPVKIKAMILAAGATRRKAKAGPIPAPEISIPPKIGIMAQEQTVKKGAISPANKYEKKFLLLIYFFIFSLGTKTAIAPPKVKARTIGPHARVM